jgi:hypothetical protein
MSVLGELDHTGMLWQSSKANPILSETTDCIQSTDYLHTKPDLLVNLDSSGNSRSLRYATPDFLLRLVVLANFMRLSLLKAAHVAAGECRVAGNPGTLRSG